MEPFQFGWPEAKAVALAVAIIGTWAVLRYGRGARGVTDPTPSTDEKSTDQPR